MKITHTGRWLQFGLIVMVCIAGWGRVEPAKANVILTPEVWLGAEWNDNVEYADSNSPQTDDIIGIIGGGLNLKRKGARSDLDAVASYEWLQYQDNTELNSDVTRLRIRGNTTPTERLKLDGYARFVEDTTFDSELQETGLVFELEDRKRYDVEGGLEYEMTERLSFEVNFDYLFIQYQKEGIDRDNKYLGLALRRRAANNVDTYSIVPSISYQTSYQNRERSFPTKETNATQYGLQLGWTRELSETWKMIVNIGARYTDFTVANTDESAWNGFGTFYFFRRGQRLSSTLSYNRTESFDFEGNLRESDIVSLFLSYLLTQRLNIEFNGVGVNSRVGEDNPGSNSIYFEAAPSLKYRLTEDFDLRLSYTYKESRAFPTVYDENHKKEDIVRTQNVVWVQLTYAYDIVW
jgi:hypothetical protein